MNLIEAYQNIYYTEDSLWEDLVNLVIEQDLFDTEAEIFYFAEELISEDLVVDFLEDLAEELEVDISYHLTENRAKIAYSALRGIINALSRAGRSKAGVKAGTALGKKPETVVKGAAASTSIRSARAAAKASPGPKPEMPGKYLMRLQTKRASRGLPAAGKTSAGTPEAIRSRAQFKAKKSELSQRGKDAQQWQKYQGMARKEVERTRQAPKPEWEKPKVALPKAKTEKGLTYTSRAVLSPAEKSGQQKYPGLAKYDMSGQRKLPSSAETLSTGRKKLASRLAAAAGTAAALSATEPKSKKTEPDVVGPKKVGPKKVGTIAQAFDREFAAARKSGKSTFEFKGKKYTTKMAEDIDYFDLVMDYLISEGYANTEEEALIIMSSVPADEILDVVNSEQVVNPWQYNYDPKKDKPTRKKPTDTRSDDQKMYDATSPRPGSRYRGD